MADNAKDTEQRKIEKIINELTERKNDINNSRALATSKSTISGTKRSAAAVELPQTAKQKNRMAPKHGSQKSQKNQSQSGQQVRTRSSTHKRNGNNKAIVENDNNESITGENSTIDNSHKMDVSDDRIIGADDIDTVDGDSVNSDASQRASKNTKKDESDGDDDDDEIDDEDDSNETPLAKKRRTGGIVVLSKLPSLRDSFVNINPDILNVNFIRDLKSKWLEIAESAMNASDEDSSSCCSSSSISTSTKSIKSSTLSHQSGSTSQSQHTNEVESVKLFNSPFKLCVLQQFLENRFFAKQLVQEMCQMEWRRKKMDLYEFHQTTDLLNLAYCSSPGLKSFYEALNDIMLPWMRQITGLRLTHVSASCSMYNFGDFLLAHDDLLSDRKIAYVFYISPWPGAENWTEAMGGALELFNCDANGQPKYPTVKKIPPRNNQFTFFRVCSKSFHQVGEVTNLIYPRLTINGWFHGPIGQQSDTTSSLTTSSALEKSKNSPRKFPAYTVPLVNDLNLNEWINNVYLQQESQISIQEHIEDKSEASLEMFLIREFYDLLVNEFKENRELQWELQGPANQRNYEILRLGAHSTGPTKDLYELFTSKAMFTLLHQFTELDLDGLNVKRPTCSVQICRFTQGCYTLLGDSSTFAESALDVILFFNAKNLVGTVTYLSPDCIGNDAHPDMNATTGSEWSGTGLSSTSTSGNAIASSHAGAATYKARAAIVPKASCVRSRRFTHRNKSNSSVTFTSEEETGADESSISFDPTEEIPLVDTENQDLTISSTPGLSSQNDDDDEDEEEVDEANDDDDDEVGRHIVEDMDDDDDDDDDEEDDDDDDDEDEDDEDNDDDLAHESVLLTIQPKNNALNLVYRLHGQAKFVKYVSKNCIDPNEYVYILAASYKE